MNAPCRSDRTMPSGEIFAADWRMVLAGMFVMLIGLVLNVAPGAADETGQGIADRAEVAPLRSLIARVQDAYPGRILEVELEREASDLWIYEVKLLTDRGQVLKLEYDAVNLELLKLKGRPGN